MVPPLAAAIARAGARVRCAAGPGRGAWLVAAVAPLGGAVGTAGAAPDPLPPPGPPPASSALLLRPVALRDRPGGRVIARISTRTSFHSPRVLAVVGRRGAWLRVLDEALPNGRAAWVWSGGVEQFASDWRIDVSLARRRLVVRRFGRIVRRVTVAVGRPANPTPTGRFAVTDKVHFRAGSPYGYGALALTAHQPRVPQGWGGGDRVAIHGTLDPASIGRAASLGCLRAGAADARWLVRRVPLGTPAVVRG